MLFSAEVLLMAMAIGLYLYDSSLLLYVNEGILIPQSSEGWMVDFGSDKAQISGKNLFIPNPFFPHRPLYRLSWQFEGNPSETEENWAFRRNALRPLVPIVWGMVVALFVLLPLGLFTRLGDRMVLFSILLLYLNIIGAFSWLWFNRVTFDLSARRVATLALESLICSPFALNIIRKVSAGILVKENLINAARRLQRSNDWNTTRAKIVACIDEQVEGEEDDSERIQVLQEHRRKLME